MLAFTSFGAYYFLSWVTIVAVDQVKGDWVTGYGMFHSTELYEPEI